VGAALRSLFPESVGAWRGAAFDGRRRHAPVLMLSADEPVSGEDADLAVEEKVDLENVQIVDFEPIPASVAGCGER